MVLRATLVERRRVHVDVIQREIDVVHVVTELYATHRVHVIHLRIVHSVTASQAVVTNSGKEGKHRENKRKCKMKTQMNESSTKD